MAEQLDSDGLTGIKRLRLRLEGNKMGLRTSNIPKNLIANRDGFRIVDALKCMNGLVLPLYRMNYWQ
jgi:hypothetical protein